MAKGPKVNDKIRQLIASVYLAHPDWKAKEIQEEVNQRLGGKGPGLSAVQKTLTPMRDPERQTQLLKTGLDEPWNLGSVTLGPDYELPPEVIPVVLETKRVRNKMAKYKGAGADVKLEAIVKPDINAPEAKEMFEFWARDMGLFTVREAKWVTRIFYVLKGRATIEEIALWAFTYADNEHTSELAEVKLDTAPLDIGLSFGDLAAYLNWAITTVLPPKRSSQDIEIELLGQNLEDIKLTQNGLALYLTWLSGAKQGKKWSDLTVEEKKNWGKRLRVWVLERESIEEFNAPAELLEEIGYVSSLGSNIGIKQNIGKNWS